MRRACLYTAMLSLSILMGFSYRSSAFVTHPGASASNVASSSRFPSSSFCSACQLERRLRGEQHPQLKHQQGRTVPQQLDWRHRPGRSLQHVLFLEREDRDKAFELLEAYIERESSSGEREEFDRIRGLVPHMQKRLWKASPKEQEDATEALGMDDFQFATKEYIPDLTSHPWWESETFPWAQQLEEASPTIQEEYRALRAQEQSESQFKKSKEGGYTSQGWTHIPLINARGPAKMYEAQRAHFPKTLKILKDLGILKNARAVLIGRQRPMSGIKKHSDGSNVIITCHLGLDIPGDEECLMWVGVDLERRAWKNNKLLCMDTSYLHWTRNNTEQERVILLLMVWHPDITPKEQRVLEYLDCLISNAAAGKPLPLHPPVPVEGGS
ncbi:unnamed protein product [Pylaiella littoralis]